MNSLFTSEIIVMYIPFSKTSGINCSAIVIFVIEFYPLRYKKMNPMIISIFSGLVELFIYL
ncbi:MAG: hypothetical protein EOM50_01040 [Erysipelotrichia bacterium]|nr:hypothetical protein [Erysipelotrichia bacterium]